MKLLSSESIRRCRVYIMVTALCTNTPNNNTLSQGQRHADARACWLRPSDCESFFLPLFVQRVGRKRPVVIFVAQCEHSSEGVVGCHARDDRHGLVSVLGEKEVVLRQHSEARAQIFSFDRCDLFRHAS